MPTPIKSAPDPSPFVLGSGSVGVLLIHGFAASPSEMRLIGLYLHRHGLTVAAPLLPGHGTTLADLSRQRWQNWVEHTDNALTELRSRCKIVFVAGISLGSLIALYLAAEHPELSGVILYSPLVKMPGGRSIHLVPLLKYFVRNVPKRADFVTDPDALDQLWCYPAVSLFAVHEMARLSGKIQPLLPRVTCPTLIIYSSLDKWIAPDSAQFTYNHIGASNKTLIVLHNSGHVVTLDSEWEKVAAQTHEFICNQPVMAA